MAAAAPSYRLRVLPVPEGCSAYTLTSHGLSDSGVVVGNLECVASPGYHPVWWDAEGMMHELATSGGRNAYALGVSRDGATVLGAADNGLMTSDGAIVTLPVLWQDGAIVELPTPGGTFGAAIDVDQRGRIVGGCGRPRGACLWVDRVPADLGGLGGPEAEAIDINSRGWIVGWASTATPAPTADGVTRVAFLHDGSVMTDLGTLGGDQSVANALNDAGEVVGSSETFDPETGFRGRSAFVWRRGVMRDLGGSASEARDINDRGDIVGSSLALPVPGERAPWVATLWRGDAIWNLNLLVPDLDGWALSDAVSIDNTGRILVSARKAREEFHLAILEPERAR